jgi:hypothetical protein
LGCKKGENGRPHKGTAREQKSERKTFAIQEEIEIAL